VEKVGFDFKKMTFLAGIAITDNGIYVGTDTPYHSLEDLQKAEKVRFGTTAIGAKSWFDCVLSGKVLGINAVPVPGYKRSPEIKLAVQRGDVDAGLHDPPLLRAEVKEGVLRPILFLGTERDPLWPNVPSAKELGVGEIIPLQRMVRLVIAPPNLPKDIEDVLSEALWKVLQDKDFLAWAERTKYPVNPMTSKEVKQSMVDVAENFEKHIDYLKSQLKQ
jgi:tripartite-type tricarboxylate transporter receptor subunit TctC